MISRFEDEFSRFIENRIFPLLGVTKSNSSLKTVNGYLSDNCISLDPDGFVQFACSRKVLYRLDRKIHICDNTISLIEQVIRQFEKMSVFKNNSTLKNGFFENMSEIDKHHLLIVESGLCNWIAKNNKNSEIKIIREIASCVHEIISKLEVWSVKTYEGKKPTIGIVINFDKDSGFGDNFGNFLDVIDKDYFAVFTDCINGVIELDPYCNFCKYSSITENGVITEIKPSAKIPLRFSHIIERFIPEKSNSIGIFLLSNGDILIIKNGALCFVKRNLKWLSVDLDSFKNSIGNLVTDNKFVESIYSSMIDVSFAHSGGIISVVSKKDSLTNNEDDGLPILSKFDDISNELSLNTIKSVVLKENKKYEANQQFHLKISEPEIDSRLLKRKFIKCLVNNKKFVYIDRRLRSELIALDGACILDSGGNVLSFGAIIKNDSGSSGGGRGAAAKKLSKYGFAIKISTDGYIEVYKEGSKVYVVQ